MERLTQRAELRAEGRTVAGVVMRYGDLGDRNEKFAPGSLIRQPDAWLNVLHDPKAVIGWEGSNVVFEDRAEALTVRAELPRIPAADLALDGIRSGKLNGLSVEFESIREHRENQTGTRVLESARFFGAGLVAAPSYGLSRLETRQRTGPSVAGRIRLNTRLACSCRDGCDATKLQPRSMDAALAEAKAGDRNVTAFMTGRYDRPLGRVGDGLTVTRTGNRLNVRLDALPDTTDVQDWLKTVEGGGQFTIRPYFPARTSDILKQGTTAVVRRADLRGFEIAAITGATFGLAFVTVGRDDDQPERRTRRWL